LPANGDDGVEVDLAELAGERTTGSEAALGHVLEHAPHPERVCG
jgi:hypothetical protein